MISELRFDFNSNAEINNNLIRLLIKIKKFWEDKTKASLNKMMTEI